MKSKSFMSEVHCTKCGGRKGYGTIVFVWSRKGEVLYARDPIKLKLGERASHN
jgi:hypothetical protein